MAIELNYAKLNGVINIDDVALTSKVVEKWPRGSQVADGKKKKEKKEKFSCKITHNAHISIINSAFDTEYSRMDQVKFVEDSL